jgi:hypothetical protein
MGAPSIAGPRTNAGSLAIFAAILRASSLLSNLAAQFAAPAHMHTRANYSIREPVVAIGDRKGLLACFANGISRRSNMVTNDLVDRVTDRTGIQRGGCCGRHRACSIREARRDYMVGLPGLNCRLILPSKKKLKRGESATVPTCTTKQASNSSTDQGGGEAACRHCRVLDARTATTQ